MASFYISNEIGIENRFQVKMIAQKQFQIYELRRKYGKFLKELSFHIITISSWPKISSRFKVKLISLTKFYFIILYDCH